MFHRHLKVIFLTPTYLTILAIGHLIPQHLTPTLETYFSGLGEGLYKRLKMGDQM